MQNFNLLTNWYDKITLIHIKSRSKNNILTIQSLFISKEQPQYNRQCYTIQKQCNYKQWESQQYLGMLNRSEVKNTVMTALLTFEIVQTYEALSGWQMATNLSNETRTVNQHDAICVAMRMGHTEYWMYPLIVVYIYISRVCISLQRTIIK